MPVGIKEEEGEQTSEENEGEPKEAGEATMEAEPHGEVPSEVEPQEQPAQEM
jgi:hypothetical protein